MGLALDSRLCHLCLLAFNGISPLRDVKRKYRLFSCFAFYFPFKRWHDSTGLTKLLAVKRLMRNGEGESNFSASFGATMGQNGCAGLYPAMLAVMIAPTIGINPLDPSFIISLIAIVTISSFRYCRASVVCSDLCGLDRTVCLGYMPVALAGLLLISIEPLIVSRGVLR